jgi:hypothetical protein
VADRLVSPELALVDPELRAHALEDLPPVSEFEFLERPPEPRRHPDLEAFSFLADRDDEQRETRSVSRPVAAVAYAAESLVRMLVFDLVGVAVLVVVIAILARP